jgi:hypothetical protein
LPNNNTDIEVEILLKEYEKLRDEIISRETSRTQLTTIAIVLVGGFITAIPFLLFSDSQGLHLRIPSIFFVFILLAISIIFTSLLWTHMLHDFEVGCIANYFHQGIRTRACQLLQVKENSAWVFNWDCYHIRLLFPSSPLNKICLLMLSLSRYAIMLIPALLSLIGAGLVYLTYFSIPAVDELGWFAIGLFAFNFFYIFAAIIGHRYIQHVYQNVPHPLF